MLPRRRTVGEEEESDITHGFDVEKRSAYATRDSSVDIDMGSSSLGDSPASSKNDYSSQDSMLHNHRGFSHHPPRRRLAQSIFFRVPHRTTRWVCLALMSTIVLFILLLVRMSWSSTDYVLKHKSEPPPPPWQSFDFLKRYYGGIRTLVPPGQVPAEFPNDNERPALDVAVNVTAAQARPLPTSQPVLPYPNYGSAEYTAKYVPVTECFLDAADSVRVPQVHGYSGLPEGFPEPLFGSYDVVAISSSICYDRYGRLGPYGYGYSQANGGSGAGLDGEREGADEVFRTTPKVDYSKVRWADAQSRCLARNKERFSDHRPVTAESFRDMALSSRADGGANGNATAAPAPVEPEPERDAQGRLKIARTAVVIRIWVEYGWTTEAILYMRGLISELAILSGGEYQVHFLIHVKDDNKPIWSSEKVYNETLERALPEEFRGMGTLWSERQMSLIYGGLHETSYRGLPVYGVYRSAHLPLQYFALKHPEYSYIWNWEMDARYTGHWYKLFESLRAFGRDQPRKGLWERNGRFFIPSVHGTWEDFRQMVRVQSEMPAPVTNKWANAGPPGTEPPPAAEPPVWGARAPEEVVRFASDPQPPTTYDKDRGQWGVGEEADLITLNPLFDPERTDWLLNNDVTGWSGEAARPPRRTAIITASRLSRRLLLTMHEEVAIHRHSMFSEMWPATAALHHGLKAVYAPHPMYIDRAWPPAYAAKIFNGGLHGATGGARSSAFSEPNTHNFRGVSWYYNAGFPRNLWRRWLGLRVDGGGGELDEVAREGRMCMPGLLLHPVKDFDVVVEEPSAADPKDEGA